MRTLFACVLLAGATAAAAGCGNSREQGTIKQSFIISDCGGFGANGGILLGDPAAYCDAEVLHWQYDRPGQALTMTDARIMLNCCGDRSMVMAQDGNAFLITEKDGGTRCHCGECAFDFTLEASGIAGGVITLGILRDISDSGHAPQTVFEGSLDLSLSAGTVVLDESDASTWCHGP